MFIVVGVFGVVSRRYFGVLVLGLVMVSVIAMVAYYDYWRRNRDSDRDGIKDIDEIEKYHTNPLKPNPNVKNAVDLNLEKYIDVVKPLDEDGIQDINEKQFIELMKKSKDILDVNTFINYLKEKAIDGKITNDELVYSNNFAKLVKGLYDEISNFYFTNMYGHKIYINYKTDVIDYASSLGLRLNFDREIASNSTVRAIAYYGIAVKKGDLPEDIEAVYLLTRGTQIEKYGNNLVDFEPIVIRDAYDKIIVIESYDRARDTWMIAYLIKQRPDIIEQPKKFEWVNRMIQQIAFQMFNDPFRPSHYDNKNYYPTDSDVWEVILGFYDYMDKLPSKMERDNLPVFFHYWDSDLLKNEIPDKLNRTMALFYLASFPYGAFDRDKYEIIEGMNAYKLFVRRLPEMYDWVVSAWKNRDSEEYYYAMVAYKMWLQDRRANGLSNVVEQFSGVWPFEEEGTIDDFLNKNFFAWKFAKFPYAYLRGRAYWADGSIPTYGEWDMYRYELPLAYKSVGIPFGMMYATGTSRNFGGPGNPTAAEYVIRGIPQEVIDSLLSQKNLGRIAVGYGNGISLLSAIDGVEKDSGFVIYDVIRKTEIYLWKK